MGSRRTSGGSRHLRFEKLPIEKGRKLHKYLVFNDQFEEEIGLIRWRGGWRQYVFRSHDGVEMSRSCNTEINNFIDGLMSARRSK
jgi:hypothetical protein